jgi:antirestriction protein ArdC
VNILELANPKIKAFVNATKAKVLSLEEFDTLIGGMTKNDKTRAFNSRGFYNPKHDVIVINTAKVGQDIMDRTLLHELGHWSGHSTRMRRKVIISEETKDSSYKAKDFDTEEVIAETIAFKLGSDMGLMTPDWEEKSIKYLKMQLHANEFEAQMQVKQAVWFLINIAMPNLDVG